jgi:UDPglucose 6-dehydrogenase
MPKKVLSDVIWCDDPYTAMTDADAVVIVTEWNEFRGLNLDKVASIVKTKCIVDMRNIYKLPEMEEHGFRYISIGRPELKTER